MTRVWKPFEWALLAVCPVGRTSLLPVRPPESAGLGSGAIPSAPQCTQLHVSLGMVVRGASSRR